MMTQRACPAPGPPRHLILTREAAGCESRPEPDGLRTRALQPLSEPHSPPRWPRCRVPTPAAERAREQLAFVRGRLAPHLLLTQRRGACEAAARREKATRARPRPGGPCRWPAERAGVCGPSGAGGRRGAWGPCAAWGGRGCRARAAAPIEGRWGGGAPWRGGNPGCCSVGSLLHPRPSRPRPWTQAAAAALPAARCPPCLPGRQDGVSVPKPAPTGQTKAGSCCFERW